MAGAHGAAAPPMPHIGAKSRKGSSSSVGGVGVGVRPLASCVGSTAASSMRSACLAVERTPCLRSRASYAKRAKGGGISPRRDRAGLNAPAAPPGISTVSASLSANSSPTSCRAAWGGRAPVSPGAGALAPPGSGGGRSTPKSRWKRAGSGACACAAAPVRARRDSRERLSSRRSSSTSATGAPRASASAARRTRGTTSCCRSTCVSATTRSSSGAAPSTPWTRAAKATGAGDAAWPATMPEARRAWEAPERDERRAMLDRRPEAALGLASKQRAASLTSSPAARLWSSSAAAACNRACWEGATMRAREAATLCALEAVAVCVRGAAVLEGRRWPRAARAAAAAGAAA